MKNIVNTRWKHKIANITYRVTGLADGAMSLNYLDIVIFISEENPEETLVCPINELKELAYCIEDEQ